MFIPHYVSCVMCHVSRVTCRMSKNFFLHDFIKKKIKLNKKKYLLLEKNGQSGGASWWRVCYQRGLPRLVYGKTVLSSSGDVWKSRTIQNHYFYSESSLKYLLSLTCSLERKEELGHMTGNIENFLIQFVV